MVCRGHQTTTGEKHCHTFSFSEQTSYPNAMTRGGTVPKWLPWDARLRRGRPASARAGEPPWDMAVREQLIRAKAAEPERTGGSAGQAGASQSKPIAWSSTRKVRLRGVSRG